MSCKDWTCILLRNPLLVGDDNMNILHYSTRDSSRQSGIFGLLLTLALFVGTWHWDCSEWCLYNSKGRLSKLVKTNGPRAVGVYVHVQRESPYSRHEDKVLGYITPIILKAWWGQKNYKDSSWLSPVLLTVIAGDMQEKLINTKWHGVTLKEGRSGWQESLK